MSEIIIKESTPKTHKALLVKSTKSVVAPDEVFSYFDLPVVSDGCDGYCVDVIPSCAELGVKNLIKAPEYGNFAFFVEPDILSTDVWVLNENGDRVCSAFTFVGMYVLFDIIVEHNKEIFNTKEKQILLSKTLHLLSSMEHTFERVLKKLNTPNLKAFLRIDENSEISVPEDVRSDGSDDSELLFTFCNSLVFAGNCVIVGKTEYTSEGNGKISPMPDYPLEVAANLILTGKQANM